MAEFFKECVRQVRSKLGLTDHQLAKKLGCLKYSTKKCILNNSFGVDGKSFQVEKSVGKFTEFYKIIDYYYECTSFPNIDLFSYETTENVISDEDFDLLTTLAPNLTHLKFLKAITDISVERLLERCTNLQILYLNASHLTDAALVR
jgi:hypothetical protein